MRYLEENAREFIADVASKDPVPGGGSVAALVGALGAALGNMVASLTVGKKTYAAVEEEMQEMIVEIRACQANLLELVEKDIEIFEPLSRLYRVHPKTKQEKRQHDVAMEKALYDACMVPMDIIRECGRAIELSRDFATKGNRIAVSDAASSAVLCKAAMQAASLNVYINTNMMKNKKVADRLNGRCASYIVYYSGLADGVFGYTANKLMNTVL
ncbi:MAG: cyclodeaminase/cyclohydrolase family protein [Firmicutes bacterium]|nr:cyclodeaminase/cyclohydrolase family protein [Bacillota bacterium]